MVSIFFSSALCFFFGGLDWLRFLFPFCSQDPNFAQSSVGLSRLKSWGKVGRFWARAIKDESHGYPAPR